MVPARGKEEGPRGGQVVGRTKGRTWRERVRDALAAEGPGKESEAGVVKVIEVKATIQYLFDEAERASSIAPLEEQQAEYARDHLLGIIGKDEPCRAELAAAIAEYVCRALIKPAATPAPPAAPPVYAPYAEVLRYVFDEARTAWAAATPCSDTSETIGMSEVEIRRLFQNKGASRVMDATHNALIRLGLKVPG